MAEIPKEAISAAKTFCEAMKTDCEAMGVEKELRVVIANITAKLNRSDLSAAEGERLANKLAKAYELLKPFEPASAATGS